MKTKLLVVLTLVGLTAACATPRARKHRNAKDASAKATDGSDSAVVPDVNVEEASLRGKEFQPMEGLEAIYFEYDSSSLKDAQLATLKKNAEYLKSHTDLELLVAGFCDERGTTEYNLALGQKRAKEVREYYIRLGVNGKSLATISYGKESPACAESSEDCWAKNRRAETRVRRRLADGRGAGGMGADKQAQ
jgi:peptidoglycan-associated lipoprotein